MAITSGVTGNKTIHEERAIKHEQFRQYVKDNHTSLHLKLVDIKSVRIEVSAECFNQVVIVYSSGRMEILPIGINGRRIKKYVGINYSRIIMWGVIPSSSTEAHPAGHKGNFAATLVKDHTDLYSEPQYNIPDDSPRLI